MPVESLPRDPVARCGTDCLNAMGASSFWKSSAASVLDAVVLPPHLPNDEFLSVIAGGPSAPRRTCT